ncbi:Gamma-aminobutyric acid receptor alpha-like, partial [Gryllus bimaculatus]
VADSAPGGGGHSGHGSSGGTSKPPWNETWTDKLKSHLLDHYDKFARPAQYSNTTVVVVDMTFRHVDLDELRSIMTVHGWVKMSWIDEKLKWSESEWGGLGVLHIADHEIWQPDIVLYNSATGNTIDHYGNTHCLVYPNGEVLWVPPSQFIVFCALDLRRWPFDEQTCHLRLGSWTYDGEQVELQLGDRGAEVRPSHSLESY